MFLVDRYDSLLQYDVAILPGLARGHDHESLLGSLVESEPLQLLNLALIYK